MKKKNPLVYVLIGVIAAVAFVAGWAGIDVLLGNAKDFVSGMKNLVTIVLAVLFGGSVASSLWKKGNKGNEKK